MALKDYGVPTVDSILKGTMSMYGDPTEGYKPLPLPKEQEPSKKEREKMAALAAQDAITREALSVIEELRSQDYWRNSSWQRKQEILDNYRNNVWPEYAKQRFGQDTTSANLLLNSVLQPLTEEMHKQRREAESWTTTFDNMLESVKRGGANFMDQIAATPVIVDTLQGDTGPEAQAAIARLGESLAETAQSEAEARKSNPQRMNDYLREQERRAANPDEWVFWHRIWEDRSLRPLVNLVAEQWPNLVTSIGAGLAGRAAGGAAGGAVAGPPGAAVGSVAGGMASVSAMGAWQSASGVATQVAQEIFDAPLDKLAQQPRYKELAAQGHDEGQIRSIMVNEAVKAIVPIAAGIGAASGALGPEALAARSSILAPLVKGGIIRRIGTGMALGAAEEFVSETAEQMTQNYGYNVATGDTRPIMEGALEAGATGAAVGGVVGGLGGIRADTDTNLSGGSTETGTPTPEQSGTVGGFNVPPASQVPVAAGTDVNAKYNPQTEAAARELTGIVENISNEADRLVTQAQSSPVTDTDLIPLFRNVRQAQQRGVGPEAVDNIFGAVQNAVNRNPNSNLNVGRAYTEWLNRTRAAELTGNTNIGPVQETTTAPASQPELIASMMVRDATQELNSLQQGVVPTDEQRASILSKLSAALINAPHWRDSINDALDGIIKNNVFPGVDVRAEFNEWMRRNNESAGPVETDGTEGTGSRTETGGEAAATQQTANPVPVSAVPQTSDGAGGATESAGAGGAARQDPGTAPADVRTNQQMGGSPANGTDSGQGSAGTDASGTEANIGERGGTGSTEQRSGDGRFSAVTGRLEESRSTVESNQILDEYQAQREQYYRESGYSAEDATKYVNQDRATAAAINDFLAETRSEIDAQQMLSTIQSLEKRLTRELKRDPQEARRAAIIVSRMLNTLSQATGQTVHAMLQQIRLGTATGKKSRRGVFRFNKSPFDWRYASDRFIGVRLDAPETTLLHEFEHYFVNEAGRMLALMSNEEISSSVAASQLRTDLHTLAKYADVPMENRSNPTLWTDMAHEKITTAFERYLMDGVVPSNTGLRAAFERLKIMALAVYEQAMKVINYYMTHAGLDDLYNRAPVYKLRNEIYNKVLPEDIRKVFDNQLRGYHRAIDDMLTELGLDVSLSTRVALDARFSGIMNSMISTGMDMRAAYAFAADYMRRAVNLSTMEPTAQIEAEVNSTNDTSVDYTANSIDQVEAEPNNVMAQAIDEAMQDPMDMTSPLATLGNTPTYVTEQLVSGILTPEVELAARGPQNGIMLDDPSMTVKGDEMAMYPPHVPTQEETAAEVEQLGAELNESMAVSDVTPTAQEETNPDGTSDINEFTPLPDAQQEAQIGEMAEIITSNIGEQQVALQRGREMAAYFRSGFTDVTYAPQWQAGRWAKMCTYFRRNWVDGGADFRTYCMEYLSNANANPDATPLWQTFSNLRNRITGATRLFVQNVMEPQIRWANQMAGRFNVDVDTFMNDIGMYRTGLHTIETAFKQRIELEQALQEAYTMQPGQEKVDAVKAAKEALESFIKRQQGDQTANIKLYGGRSVAEAQAEIDRVVSRYGREVCEEGNAHLARGYSWVTRYLMENGQLSAADMARFDEWNHYCAMTTDKIAGTGGINDISYYAPRQNFHRYGSHDPAQNAWRALVQYGMRASRSVGMSEFGHTLHQAYLMFEKQGNVTSQIGATKFYNHMALVPENVVNGIRYGEGKTTPQAERWAKHMDDSTDVVIRVLETDENGNDVIRSYRVLFDDEKVHQSVRNPFYASDPDVFYSRLAKYTSGYASLYTRFKPYFPVLTSVRDLTERISYLPVKNYTNDQGQSVSGAKIAAQMIGFAANPVNFIRLARFWTRGTSGSEYIDNMMHDFKASGVDSSSSYNELLRSYRNKTITDMNGVMPESVKKLGAKRIRELNNVVSKWSDFFYSLPAFAQFIKMRENGINMRDTVNGVTELMNMNQRGRFTSTYLSPFFPFVNSIGQTASNLLGALGLHTAMFGNHPNAKMLRMKAIKGWAVMFTWYAATRALIPLMQESLGEGEEGERRLDLIPLGQLSNFFPIGMGDGSYVKWPTGFGPAMLGAMAAYGFDRVERGKMSANDLGFTMLTTFAKTLVPNSMPAFEFSKNPMQYLVQSFSPMLFQPIVQVATGYSYSGSKLVYDTYDSTTRKSDRYNLTTDRTWVNAAKGLYDAVGVDMAPEEIRALANGYLGGVLQGVMSIIEADPLYKNPNYQSTREALGPFWTTLGATSIYDVGMNVSQSSFYAAKDHYDEMILKAGIGSALRGSEDEKRRVLLSAGFTQQEVDDYFAIAKAYKGMSDLNSETRKQLDRLFGPDMDEETIRRVYIDWSIKRQGMQEQAVRGLNFFNRNYFGRFEAPDVDAAAALRREVHNAPVEPGNIDLMHRPVVKNPDGSISTVLTMTEQDQDGLWVNFPTIGPNGERWTPEQAWRYYLATGQHLGKFRTLEAAEAAAQSLHKDQEALYVN